MYWTNRDNRNTKVVFTATQRHPLIPVEVCIWVCFVKRKSHPESLNFPELDWVLKCWNEVVESSTCLNLKREAIIFYVLKLSRDSITSMCTVHKHRSAPCILAELIAVMPVVLHMNVRVGVICEDFKIVIFNSTAGEWKYICRDHRISCAHVD